ncbi:MAG: hypothetical protein JWM19_5059 [Actinomycetia bacterium]|nr:hypothetical protein [Actinomycetes bacterium]
MAQARNRDQPGAVPPPRQDDKPRRAGRQDSQGAGRATGDSSLAWSVTAMADALARLAAATTADAPRAVAAATESVWWITAVDAAMTRHHPQAYGRALAALDPAARRSVERSIAGLRYIRSQLGLHADPADFIRPQAAEDAGIPATAWTWHPVSPPRAQRSTVREQSPYREYRAQLAGRPLGDALRQAAGFLCYAHASVAGTRHHDHPMPFGAGLALPG